MITFEDIDKEIKQNREELIEKLVQFSLTDMMLFWGSEKDLVERQKKTWNPILQWCSQTLDAQIEISETLDVPQNKEAGYRMRIFLNNLNDKELAAFYATALLTRSVLLACAFVKGKVSVDEAFEAANLEEIWQSENWGVEEEAENRRNEIKKDLEAIDRYLKS